jgi:hypothetical protein
MDFLMSPTIIDPGKRLPTSRTSERSISKMTSLMTFQINIPREALIANIAGEFSRNLSPTQNLKMWAAFSQIRMVDVNMTIPVFVTHEA